MKTFILNHLDHEKNHIIENNKLKESLYEYFTNSTKISLSRKFKIVKCILVKEHLLPSGLFVLHREALLKPKSKIIKLLLFDDEKAVEEALNEYNL